MKNLSMMRLFASSLLTVGCVAEPGDPEVKGSGLGTTTDETEPATTTGAPVEEETTTGGAAEGGNASTGTPGASSSGDPVEPPIFFDVGGVIDAPPSSCTAPVTVSCDHLDDDPWHAIGVNCPGAGPQIEGEINYQGPQQLYVHEGNLGTFMPPPFPPREGEKFVILSSGAAQDLTIAGHYASTSVGGMVPLPPPIQTNVVDGADTCADNPALIGTGDCSNTIQAQWDQGNGAFDYAEMRITATVPAGTPGFSYDFAMFSTEYPNYYQTQFNDMYIAWLESEQWTGNISFDDMGNPISLNAGFLDFKDAPNPYDCPAPCVAPELQGTAMQGHAGTRWLTTSTGVIPGETIELVLAVFDLSDTILDTVMIIDNWHWDCGGGPPITIPG